MYHGTGIDDSAIRRNPPRAQPIRLLSFIPSSPQFDFIISWEAS